MEVYLRRKFQNQKRITNIWNVLNSNQFIIVNFQRIRMKVDRLHACRFSQDQSFYRNGISITKRRGGNKQPANWYPLQKIN